MDVKKEKTIVNMVIPEEFKNLQQRLQSLIDTDPAKAVEEARSILPDAKIEGISLSGLKAGILIDAGSCINNREAIAEGLELFREMLQEHPEHPQFHYNIANGLVSLADQEPYKDTEWYLATGAIRTEARTHFKTALSSKGSESIASVAFTNLGNALVKAHRWVEAYDSYVNALRHDSTNGVASTGAAKILLRCIDRSIGDREILLSIAARHLEIAKAHPDRIKELAGAQAFEELSKLLEKPLKGGQMPDLSQASAYERFVASHRLMLSPTIEGLDVSLKRWDSLVIRSLSEPVKVGGPHRIPPLFAMFNVMKADFLLARYLAFQALNGKMPDSGFYSDTLDYAVYGVKPAALALAQRACMDILDKIAVATAEYFGLKKKDIYFATFWFEKKKGQPLTRNPELSAHIKQGNTGIIALAEVSLDLGEKGFLHEKKHYRHASTHQFTVFHDLGCEPSRPSSYIDHCEADTFESILIESLQLTRAAFLYFADMVQIAEAQKESSLGKGIPLFVPTHHSIRGEDEENPEDSEIA
jgi:tetratricopeptide (TPR) repeat protein